MRRHLLLVVLSFAAGIAAEYCRPQNMALWLLLAGLSLIWGIYLIINGSRRQAAVLLAAVLFMGAFWLALALYPQGLYLDLTGQMAEGEGLIITYPRSGEFNLTFIVRVENLRVGETQLPGLEKLLLCIQPSPGQEFYPGSRVSFRGELLLPREARNPGQFDYRRYLANQQVFYQVQCGAGQCRLLEKGRGLRSLAARGRQEVSAYLSRLLPEEERGLLLGLLFGDVSSISPEDYEGYQRTGVVHLFAVSGFHVSLLLALVWFLLSFFQVSSFWRLTLALPILLTYFFLVGWTASMVRAALMSLLALLALLLGRKTDIFTSLALAALLILIVNPGELFQLGFQFSFLTTLGLAHLTPWLLKRGLARFSAPALAAYLASLPLTAYYFNLVSLISPFLNIGAVLVGGLATVLSLAGCILTWTIPTLAAPLFLAAGFLIYCLSRFILWWAHIPWTAVTVPAPPLPAIFMLYGLLLALPTLWYYRFALRQVPVRIRVGMTCFLVLFLIILCWPAPQPLQVIFLDVGQGDSIFIRTPGGYTALIDGGGTPDSPYSVGRKIIRPFLQRQGLERLDLMIMTHNHLDHSEGLLEVIPLLSVGTFLMPAAEGNNQAEADIKDLCRERKIPLLEVGAGQRILLEKDIYMEVLHPAQRDSSIGNNHSLVIRLVHGETEWLLTGDIEKEGLEQLLVQAPQLRADFLKLPHHGSISSYDEKFYRAVAPQAVVASVGFNYFNQPHPQVTGYFTSRSIPCYVTRDNGAIITESNGKRIIVRPMIP